MLEGGHRYPIQKSMEILVSLGECYDAQRQLRHALCKAQEIEPMSSV